MEQGKRVDPRHQSKEKIARPDLTSKERVTKPATPTQSGQTPPPPRPPRKSRKKSEPLFSSTWMYLLFVFGVSALLAAVCWTAANDVLALNKKEHTAVITIQEQDSYGSVVDQLKKNGIIRYRVVFRLFSALANADEKVSAGSYELNTDMDYHAIINNMSAKSDSRMTTSVTIPEGYSTAQIFALLEEKGVSSAVKLEDMAANHDYNFSFLKEIPLGDSKRLEGYLFPDTYQFYMGENPLYVLNKMLVNFDSKMTEAVRAQIAGTKYSLPEILTIASMIEKETDGTDRGKIASVIYNRLEHPTKESAGYLNIDATIQYVLPVGQIVTPADYQGVDNLYNTYQHKGLPPGPVGNPGLEAINAALQPEKTKYYFYALGDDGAHHFFKTYAEHKKFLGS